MEKNGANQQIPNKDLHNMQRFNEKRDDHCKINSFISTKPTLSTSPLWFWSPRKLGRHQKDMTQADHAHRIQELPEIPLLKFKEEVWTVVDTH